MPQNYTSLYSLSINQLIIIASKVHLTLSPKIKQKTIQAQKLHLTLSTLYHVASYQSPKTTPHSFHPLSSSQVWKAKNHTSHDPPSIM